VSCEECSSGQQADRLASALSTPFSAFHISVDACARICLLALPLVNSLGFVAVTNVKPIVCYLMFGDGNDLLCLEGLEGRMAVRRKMAAE